MIAANRTWILALVGLAMPSVSVAQTFPPDAQWVPIHCGNAVMTDPYRDTVGAFDERDLVGDTTNATGYRAYDAQFLYLRLRLDADPLPGGTAHPYGWGFEIDTDGVPSTYEILILADGVAGQLRLFRNSATTLPNDPNDPADPPPVASYPLTTHGRSVLAAGSRFGNNNDYFIDMAVPWSDLQPLGLTPITFAQVWAASSTSTNSLNGDFACFDGAMGTPTLSGILGERGGLGAGGGGGAAGTGGASGAGGLAQGNRFEGGPGCSCRTASAVSSGNNSPSSFVLLALAFALGCARLRRSRGAIADRPPSALRACHFDEAQCPPSPPRRRR